jgi:endonuclease/exonuclease/phosphatase family metal-dependent hydrolase
MRGEACRSVVGSLIHPDILKFVGFVFLALILINCAATKQNYLDPEGPRYVGHFAPETRVFTGQIKVISFNIKMAEKIEEALEELVQDTHLRNADIILLQEMDPQGAQEIAEAIRCNYVYYPSTLHPSTNQGMGNAILSRWPIVGHQKIILPHEHPLRKIRRNAVFATIQVADFEVLACSVHTEMYLLGHEKKIDQVEELLKNIGAEFKHIVVGGDFNTETQYAVRETERVFRKAGFVRSNKELGPTARGDPLGLVEFELDHLFIRGFKLLSVGKSEASQASDHMPIWAVMGFEQ